MIRRLEVISVQGDTETYTSYKFSTLLDTIKLHPDLPRTKSVKVKVTEEEEYVKLCALCDEHGLDKVSVELAEPVLNF